MSLSYRDVLFENGYLTECEESKKLSGYYVPENIYLKLKNKNLC